MINFSFDGKYSIDDEDEIMQHDFIEALDEEDDSVIFQAFPESWEELDNADLSKLSISNIYIDMAYIDSFPNVNKNDFIDEEEFAIEIQSLDQFEEIIKILKQI